MGAQANGCGLRGRGFQCQRQGVAPQMIGSMKSKFTGKTLIAIRADMSEDEFGRVERVNLPENLVEPDLSAMQRRVALIL